MGIHSWWTSYGTEIENAELLAPAAARELTSTLASRTLPGATLVSLKQCTETGYAAVHFRIDVERPQDLEHPIRATEDVAVFFHVDGRQPRVLALRDDFPDTFHQNGTPPDTPCSICVDDRPWPEAQLTATPAELVRRIQLWLAKAARGELHDPSQPLEPLFFQSPLALIIPATALVETVEPFELVGFVRPDNQQLIIARRISELGPRTHGLPGFIVLAFQAQPQSMSRLRHAPVTLATLADELQRCGINLLNEIKARLKAWAGITNDNVRRLSSRLAIVVVFPVAAGANRTAIDLRAFMTFDVAGDIGVALGLLHKNVSNVGAKEGYVAAISSDKTSEGKEIRIEPAQVHFAFDRALGATVAGHDKPDIRQAVLVGAGSLGSQVAIDLAREGAFSWTIVDQDYLLPHNFARHALFSDSVGAPKALALALQVSGLLNEPVVSVNCDVMNPDEESRKQLESRLDEAELVIDASASVAVSRHLADLMNTAARRVCAFFNPAGTALVLLVENSDRLLTLRELEAQYHRLVLTEPRLAAHLRVEQLGVRYSGSCRSLTNRIPATKAALLSALAARGIANSLKSEQALVGIWQVGDDGDVQTIKQEGRPVHRVQLGGWDIIYDDGLLDQLVRLRESRLPHETGGVLLGIADMSRKSIHVVHALPQPEDSHGSVEGFERGVVGLREEINRAVESSMHQIRYIGEWHSHPRHSSPWPSTIDLAQLMWLGGELNQEGLPALMAIAADDGRFAFVLAESESAPRLREGGRNRKTG